MEMKVSQVGCFQLFLISHKMTYMGLAIVEIADRRTWKQNWRQTFDCKFALQTVQDMVLDSYIRKIASSQVTFSDVFNVIFEISRHLFLVFLLLTLNIVFFFAKYVVSKITELQPIVFQKRDSTWKFSWGFSAELIRTRVNDIQVK